MDKLFGIPMVQIMVVMVVLMLLCMAIVAYIAVRRRVIFKLGIRNIPRRKAQTVLIVIGLMLSTLIISAALGTGDTIDRSVSSEIYDLLGPVDIVVVYSQDIEGNASTALSQKIPAETLPFVREALADDPNVAAIGAMLFETVPVLNMEAGRSEPNMVLAGVDPATLDDFGGLENLAGEPIDLAATDLTEVVLSESAAEDLSAAAGDEIVLFYGNQPLPLTVADVAPDSPMSGVIDLNISGMVVPLDRMQQATGQEDLISLVAISNTGGVRQGGERTDQVVAVLEPELAGRELGIDPIKQANVEQAETAAQIFTSLFLIFGLFSISVGILLIVLIFTMLAAERRPEMGMTRAVGGHRRQLIQQFIAEGAGYSLLAGLVGAALGVLATIGIASGIGILFGDFLEIQPHIEPRSLIVAYCLGVVITFTAVVASSWKISRLNIVAAVRDIPEVSSPRRKRSVLAWGLVMVLLGAFLIVSGVDTRSAFAFYTGMSLVPFGLATLLRFAGMPERPVLTIVGLWVLLFWLLPDATSQRIFGAYDGGIELLFVSGIFMVAAATLVIVQNLGSLLGLIGMLGGVFRSKLPAIRTAVAYPGAARGRTGMTIAMFSLIIFSLVVIATINQNFMALFLGEDADAGWDVRVDVMPANPIDDIVARLDEEGVDTEGITATGVVTQPNMFATQLRMPETEDWQWYQVKGMDDDFITLSTLRFGQRAEGYESDDAVIEALQTEPNVAVIDPFAVPNPGNVGQDPDMFQLTGLQTSDRTFEPITIEVSNPQAPEPVQMTVIGVIESGIGSLFGLYTSQETVDEIYPPGQFTQYFLQLGDPVDAEATAHAIEGALLMNGAQATSIQSELEEAQRQNTGFLYIIQGFMALGLIVGVAAVGVIAFRSVVERRQQIGVLRALGYQRGTVALSFVVESAFVVALGVISGTAMGLVLSRNIITSDDFAAASNIDFLVPWELLTVIIVATIIMALLMTWIPARQASRIAPAEALRYE
jgi:putative ABC transport system permease protein